MVGADKEDAAKKQKGSKSLPKGVIETGRKTIKYQARVSYKPDGSKTVQRNAGTFNTPEEAALQIAVRDEACRRYGSLGWSGDSLSAQARPGVALHSRAPLLPHPCVPQPQGSTLAGTANED